jgi:two-component system nitrate/nitrite response regulator NarL
MLEFTLPPLAVLTDGRIPEPLTDREREIAYLVSRGYRNKEIAEALEISEQTVKNHLRNIFEKLGVADRLSLALYTINSGAQL